ncbi:hypothetical protein [Methylopila sp. 73B]|uniref:hypothetical protein n=1 Tax=Methylopila sp. 73B TaxID=1120792 RepID=UPI000360939B|nr:hypothetical protein [Methylopila sp. 73B]
MPAFRAHSAEEIERARTLYEETDVSPADIARLMGLGVNTFYRRVKDWGWRRRRLRVEESDAIAREALKSADPDIAAYGRAWEEDKRSSAERAEAAILAQIAALEGLQVRAARAALDLIDSERAARTLWRLAQALNEVEKLRRADAAPRKGQAAARASEPEVDLDALRAELGRRLENMRKMYDEEE